MNTMEFKAWFRGFCEAVGDAPTPEQWAKIKREIEALEALSAPIMMPPVLGPHPGTSIQPQQWPPVPRSNIAFTHGDINCKVT